MLLAIDVGNTHTVFGVWNGSTWLATWRHRTDIEATEDELGAWLYNMFALAGIEFRLDQIVIASVVPGYDRTLSLLAADYFHLEPIYLRGTSDHGIKVDYEPKSAVGADRIANAIGALEHYPAPVIVVDFGTATTFDVIDENEVYCGGAIMPGPLTSLHSLVTKTAKLPAIDLRAPESAIGKSTTHSIESGLMFGYAGAIDAIVKRISKELNGTPKVVSTGGLGGRFLGICESIDEFAPMLTLDGIRLFADSQAQSDA